MSAAGADDKRPARADPARLRLVSILAAHEGGEARASRTGPPRDHDDGGSRRATVWPALLRPRRDMERRKQGPHEQDS